MAMKREVPRIGGYRQEFFASQTPELAAMADVVIASGSESVGLRFAARSRSADEVREGLRQGTLLSDELTPGKWAFSTQEISCK